MSLAKAHERVQILNQDKITIKKLKQVLGEMTFEESLEALVGTGGIKNLQGDSLIKRYLDANKEKGYEISTFVGRFKKGPGYSGRGDEKLFISVDPRAASLLEEIISDNPHLLMHTHTPHQGTLSMKHRGLIIAYAGQLYEPSTMNDLGVGSILPVIPLSSVESSNTINYFDLGRIRNKYAKYPWGFRNIDEQNGVDEAYCRTGGYNSCTHWVGEMPIGEKFVSEYSMPGYVGDDPYYNPLGDNDRSQELRTKEVGKFNVFKSPNGYQNEIGTKERQDRLARIVWTHGVGREQLWSMVGDRNAEGLAKGEWANPGWVLYSFLTRTTQDRVPVVFLFREFATEPLDQNTIDEFTTKISPH